MNWKRNDPCATEVAEWTGDRNDILEREDLILAGCLWSLGNMDADDEYLAVRGKELLHETLMESMPRTERQLRGGPTQARAAREALLGAWNNVKMNPPLRGFRLTPQARGLAEAARACRVELEPLLWEKFRLSSHETDRRYGEIAGRLNDAMGDAFDGGAAGRGRTNG